MKERRKGNITLRGWHEGNIAEGYWFADLNSTPRAYERRSGTCWRANEKKEAEALRASPSLFFHRSASSSRTGAGSLKMIRSTKRGCNLRWDSFFFIIIISMFPRRRGGRFVRDANGTERTHRSRQVAEVIWTRADRGRKRTARARSLSRYTSVFEKLISPEILCVTWRRILDPRKKWS